jgi:hypothetical protein
MANGRSMDMDDDASLEDFEGFEERNVDLSDEESDEDMEFMERGTKGVYSTAFEGACWSNHNCNIICQAKDNAKSGKCTTWSRKCRCHDITPK